MPTIEYNAFKLVQSNKHRMELIEFTAFDLRPQPLIRTMEMEFLDVVQRVRFKRMIIDFEGVITIPSAIFGLLFKLTSDLAKKRVQIHLCSLDPHVLKVFNLINQKGIIPVFPTRKLAMKEDSWKEKTNWWPFDLYTPGVKVSGNLYAGILVTDKTENVRIPTVFNHFSTPSGAERPSRKPENLGARGI